MTNIVFIGAGSMAEAIIKGLLEEEKVSPSSICVMNKSDEKQLHYLNAKYKIEIMCTKKLALQKADLVFLAMKPKDAIQACKEIASFLNKQAIVVSVIAGVSIKTIESYLGDRPIARVMPNTSASVGLSASALCWNEKINNVAKKEIINLLESIGTVKVVQEVDMHVITALSGSGPAYLYYFAEQFEAAAVQHGLSQEDARHLFIQTMKGAAYMLMKGEDEPAELRRKVTSPGGTTEAGIEQLMFHKVDEAIFACISAAQQKSRTLGEQFE